MSFIHKHPEKGWEPCGRKSEENRCPFGDASSHIELEPSVDSWAASERMNEYDGLTGSLKGKKKSDRTDEEKDADKEQTDAGQKESAGDGPDEARSNDEDNEDGEENNEDEEEQKTETEEPTSPTTEEEKETTLPKNKTRYSFLKAFKEEQEQFEHDFGEYPKRFFSTDLRQKGKRTLFKEEHLNTHDGEFYHTQLSLEEQIEVSKNKEEIALNGSIEDRMKIRAVNAARIQSLSNHMLSATSSPADNQMETEEVREKVNDLAAKIGEDATVTELNDDDPEHRILKSSLVKGVERGWIISYDSDEVDNGFNNPRGRSHIVIMDGNNNDRGSTYQLRGKGRGPIGRVDRFIMTDVRGLAGDSRIAHKTGDDGVLASLGTKNRATSMDQKGERSHVNQTRTLETLSALEDAQREGQNFIAQAKYVRDTNSKVATAFDDKKNLPKTHQDAMETTKLSKKNGGMFTNVELDGDVDLEEYKSFESDILDVQDKLPKGAEEKMPSLRIRKLGKHSSHKKTVQGIFSPSKNTVVLDVNTSEAFLHEMGHHHDLVQQNNASLSQEFKGIHRDYSNNLEESDAKRAAYLKTPTETLSRGFEVYAVEKLGINNRLVNPERFDGNDYKPFMEPESKKRLFAFFDNMFK